jgi:hypothetical protein
VTQLSFYWLWAYACTCDGFLPNGGEHLFIQRAVIIAMHQPG